MDDEQFKTRVAETVNDVFPLDRLLPLDTVYSIFVEEYAKESDKSIFFKNRKYQRLREGYFALFVALSFNELSGIKNYLFFPSDPSNDVYICNFEEGGAASPFDIKEYTPHPSSFGEFVEKSIIPKTDIYNVIIGLHTKNISGNELKYLIDSLKNTDAKVWLVSNRNADDSDEKISKVTVVSKSGIVYQNDIKIDELLTLSEPRIVYQDIVNLKESKLKKAKKSTEKI